MAVATYLYRGDMDRDKASQEFQVGLVGWDKSVGVEIISGILKLKKQERYVGRIENESFKYKNEVG